MISFKYKAISREGKTVKGYVEALSEFDAIAKVKAMHTTVLDIRQTRAPSSFDINDPLWISDKVLSVTASQFSILLRSGLSVVRVTELVAEQSEDKMIRRILRGVSEDINAGQSLAASLDKRGKKFPIAFIETVRAGEESGTLAECFAKLKTYYEKSDKNSAKVRRALSYPAFLSVLAIAVVIVIMNVTLPTISGIIEGFGGDLPWPTLFLTGLARFFSKWWWLVLIILAVFVISFLAYRKTDKGRSALSRLALKLPVIGKVNSLSAAAQFANTLSTMLTAGMTLPRALKIVANVVSNFSIGDTIRGAAKALEEGKRFGEALKGDTGLPPLLIEMCSIGDETGTLKDTLDVIGEYYDVEVDAASTKAVGVLEPAITVIMGLAIGFIVIALYLPMFTMYGGM